LKAVARPFINGGNRRYAAVGDFSSFAEQEFVTFRFNDRCRMDSRVRGMARFWVASLHTLTIKKRKPVYWSAFSGINA
jgi:hypothetical protein